MRILQFCLLAFIVSIASGCAVRYNDVGVATDGTAYANSLTTEQKQSINGLKKAIMSLGSNINPAEATSVAYNSVVYPMHLSNKYGLVYPPSLQNIFVNSGVKERGLCYQWTTDMLSHLRAQNYKTLGFTWVIADRGTKDEHNTAAVVAKGQPWHTGIVLDPWRNSGNLYWDYVKNDPKYKWVLYTRKKKN